MAAPLKILLAVDGSAHALAAVRCALRLAAGRPGCSFVLVNVQEPASLYEVVVAHDADRIARLLELGLAAERAQGDRPAR